MTLDWRKCAADWTGLAANALRTFACGDCPMSSTSIIRLRRRHCAEGIGLLEVYRIARASQVLVR